MSELLPLEDTTGLAFFSMIIALAPLLYLEWTTDSTSRVIR